MPKGQDASTSLERTVTSTDRAQRGSFDHRLKSHGGIHASEHKIIQKEKKQEHVLCINKCSTAIEPWLLQADYNHMAVAHCQKLRK